MLVSSPSAVPNSNDVDSPVASLIPPFRRLGISFSHSAKRWNEDAKALALHDARQSPSKSFTTLDLKDSPQSREHTKCTIMTEEEESSYDSSRLFDSPSRSKFIPTSTGIPNAGKVSDVALVESPESAVDVARGPRLPLADSKTSPSRGDPLPNPPPKPVRRHRERPAPPPRDQDDHKSNMANRPRPPSFPFPNRDPRTPPKSDLTNSKETNDMFQTPVHHQKMMERVHSAVRAQMESLTQRANACTAAESSRHKTFVEMQTQILKNARAEERYEIDLAHTANQEARERDREIDRRLEEKSEALLSRLLKFEERGMKFVTNDSQDCE